MLVSRLKGTKVCVVGLHRAGYYTSLFRKYWTQVIHTFIAYVIRLKNRKVGTQLPGMKPHFEKLIRLCRRLRSPYVVKSEMVQ